MRRFRFDYHNICEASYNLQVIERRVMVPFAKFHLSSIF